MPILSTAVDPSSAEFRENYEANRALVEELAARQAQVRQGGSERARRRLVESAGANLLYQAEFFADLGGRTFANQARMSAAGIPQIALVFGSSTAGGAYVPGLSDYTVMVKRQAKVFLGGPPLVKMATGEEVDDETLGGAEMHTHVSGLGDYLAADDADAIRIGRAIVARLNWRKEIRAQLAAPEEPAYDPDDLLGIVPADPRRPFEIREGLARLGDGSRFEEVKQDF